MSITGGQLAGFQVTAAQILALECPGIISLEKMESQPATVSARHPLGFSKERHKEKKHQIGVDLRLKLEVPRKIFRTDLTFAAIEIERGMEKLNVPR